MKIKSERNQNNPTVFIIYNNIARRYDTGCIMNAIGW